MPTDRPSTPEVLFYRVTCTEEVAESPARRPHGCCLLLLPGESTLVAQDTETEPGRWYRFRSLRRSLRVPLTADQAEHFRSARWRIDDPRPARGKAEHELVAHRLQRIAEEEDLAERRAALSEIEGASLKAQELERVDELWLVRLYRKVFPELVPSPWHEVRLAYDEQWCKARGIWYEVKDGGCSWFPLESGESPDGVYSPEFDPIRCIVLGWADGVDKPALASAVQLWREQVQPALQQLKPITNIWRPGQPLLTYLTEDFPRARARLDQYIESLPDSPPAVVKLLAAYRPIVEVLTRLAEVREANPLHTVAASDEITALHHLTRRAEKLAALLDDAERRLEASGWFAEKGKLKMRTGAPGSHLRYLSQVVSGLYAYLWPMHRRTFGDRADNPVRLRHHISLLLSPYFSKREISPAEQRSLQRLIGNFLERDPRASAVRAEAREFPAAADLPPVERGPSRLPKGHF